MEKIYRKGVGFCLISHKSFQTHRIINRSSSVFSVRSVVSSAGFGLMRAKARLIPADKAALARGKNGRRRSIALQGFR